MSLFFGERGEFGEKWSAKRFKKGRMKMKKHCDTAGKYGLKIAYYRKKKGYTQAKLAEQIGMSTAYLGQIERGNRGNSFSLETLYQIADALEIEAELLMKDEM